MINFSKGYFLAMGALLSVLLLSSCRSIPEDIPIELSHSPYAGSSLPLLLVEYFPYPELPSGKLRPMPSYSGWTDSRMRRDLSRIRSYGIDGVLLSVTPEDFAESIRSERIRRFFDLASELSPPLRVGLLVGGSKDYEIASGNIAQYLDQQGLAKHKSALLLDGKAVLAFREDIKLIRQVQHPTESFATFRRLGEDWHSVPAGATPGRLSQMEKFTWVKAGDNSKLPGSVDNKHQADWILPRGKGKNFANRLRLAFQNKAGIVCIHSWNDFGDGSFIEPNTMDGNQMGIVVFNEKQALKTAPRPAP
ncbi:MAG: hypothetical protein GX561_13110 [Lentisphaerae bacterium]|jgi:hypothetical protein|nr:hypothetical protein [Lentisphaerota bacterium]